MTELEKMIRAEKYIRKMADGINPITDEYAPDNDMINNVRISRCLFYVSDILKQVINNNGEIIRTSYKNSEKKDFYITDEQRISLTPFNFNVILKTLVEKINDITQENNCKRFAAKWVTEYLLSIGLLRKNETNNRVPTETGIEFGITSEQKTNTSGFPYWYNKYSPAAQKFIIDILDSIVEFSKTQQYYDQTHHKKKQETAEP